MSKILLIGNGPSATELKMGERIDSNEFDYVARINRWKYDEDGSEHINNFSEYVGTKCDFWFINDLHLTETQIGISKREFYKYVFVVMPKFKFNVSLANDIQNKFNNIKFIDPKFEDEVNQLVDFKPQWPSTGVIAIQFAINNFDNVYLYGFDTYSTKYDTLHYFEGIDKPYGRNKFKFKKRSDHTPSKEKDYLDLVIKNHNVEILQ